MPVVDELVTILGLEEGAQNASVARKFTGLLDGIQKKALVLAASVTTAAGALAYFVRDAVGQADELQKLTEVTGIAAETFQEWGYAAAKMGADARSVQSDIAALNKSMSSPIPGQFNMNLAMLGVHGKNAAEVLEQLSDKFQGMTAQRASQWGSMIGLSDDTIRLLREGRATINDLRSEAHTMGVVISDEDIARASEFSRTLKALGYTFNSLRQQIFIGAVPALDRFVAKVRDFLALNMGRIKDWFADFISGFTAALEQVWTDLEPLRKMFASVTDVITDFLGTGDAAETWGHLIVGAFEGALILLSPLIAKLALAGAAFSTLAVIVEDLFAYFTGANKVTLTEMLIEDFQRRFPTLTRIFDNLKDKVKDLWSYVQSDEFNVQLDLFLAGVEKAWDETATYLEKVFSRLFAPLENFEKKYPALSRIIESLKDLFKQWGFATKSAADYLGDFYELVDKLIGRLLEMPESLLQALEYLVGRAVLGYNALTGGMQEEADAIRRNDAIEEQRYQAEWDAKSGYEQALEISRRSTMGANPMGQVAGMILEKWFKNNQLPIIEQLDNQAAAQVTVPAPASVYGGTYNTTNNYNVASTNPAAAAQEIMRMQSSRDNLIEAQANGQFAAGVQ
jgi:hypothetical protein